MTPDETSARIRSLVSSGWSIALLASATGVSATGIEGILGGTIEDLSGASQAALESWLQHPSSLAESYRNWTTCRGASALGGVHTLFTSYEVLRDLLACHVALIESANEKAEDMDLDGACEQLMDEGATLARNSAEAISVFNELMVELSRGGGEP